MPTPSSGPLSLLRIQEELGGAAPISLSEYYASAVKVDTGSRVVGSGTISIGTFYNTRRPESAKSLESGALYSPSGTGGSVCSYGHGPYPADALPQFNVYTAGSPDTSGTLIAPNKSMSWYMNAYFDYGFQLWVSVNGGSWSLASAIYEGNYAQNWGSGSGTYPLNLPSGSYARFIYSAGCYFQNFISPGYITLTFNGD